VSTRYPGGLITKTPVVPAGPYEAGVAPGIWTLDQQLQAQNAGIWPTAGLQPNYIEDVFSTYLYTGNGSTQTITNGIDLSTKGGMVWLKSRSAATNNFLFDTTRGALNEINSNTTDAQASLAASLTAFNTTGFALGAAAGINVNTATYASWTFREQPKFFDVVTYTGTGANRTIAHNLGSVPGMIIVKRTDAVAAWQVYHRSLANTQYMVLNTTAAVATGATRWNSTTPTDSVFSLGTDTTVNASGGTYVAYLYAHDAGGFGLTGTDNVISCGSFTTDAGGLSGFVNLGYEPQFLIYKDANYASGTGGDWNIVDNMRSGLRAYGTSVGASPMLEANTAAAEQATAGFANATATGFYSGGTAEHTYIYIAIRRGPMKVPTDATKVFDDVARTGTGTATTVASGFPVDLFVCIDRTKTTSSNNLFTDRLRGQGILLYSNSTAAEVDISAGNYMGFDVQNGVGVSAADNPFFNNTTIPFINYMFRRAPGFFDEVCYTGTGANTTQTHNLAAVPELMLVKVRDATGGWQVYSSALANTEYLVLNTTAAKATGATRWNSTTPTSSVFSLGTNSEVNFSTFNYVAYLFATCPGVSKVGSYTGNGTTQTIDCGFGAGGVRFVLIKRTDAVGDWYVYDTARGMTVLTDPYLLFNSIAAEVATLGSVTTVSTGFALDSAILAAINVSAGTYIFLAIA
jgi:hypothetical protein